MTVRIPVQQAHYCADCNCFTNTVLQCECGSRALMAVAPVWNRETSGCIEKIADWCKAYPLGSGIFDEPDMKEVRRLLGDDLLTRVSAHNFRHVLKGIERIIQESA